SMLDLRLAYDYVSGARYLNPGPHGPEPCVCRVLPCPAGSSSALPYSISRAFVSSCVLLVPRMGDTSVTRLNTSVLQNRAPTRVIAVVRSHEVRDDRSAS